MKDYFRILGYADHIKRFVFVYLVLALIAAVFGVLNLVMLKPLLDVLFGQLDIQQLKAMALNSSSWTDPLSYFQRLFAQLILEKGKIKALGFVCICIVIISFIGTSFRYLSMRWLERFKTEMIANLRSKVFLHLISQDTRFFNIKNKSELISHVTTDIQEIESSVTYSFSAAIKESILLICYLVGLFYTSWKLTLVVLLLVPLVGGFLGITLKRMRHDAGHTQNALEQILGLLDEAFGFHKVIKAFNAQNYFREKFDNLNLLYKKANFGYASKKEMANPFSEFIGISMVAIILYFGGSMILAGDDLLSASSFIAYLAMFSQIVRPAKEISQAISIAQRGLVSARRVLGVLDQNHNEEFAESSAPKFEKEIRFSNLSFSYKPEEQLISDLNIQIPKGKMIALVGASGGGKSTIADLNLRFYEPTKGDIFVDDVKLSALDLKLFRENIGWVPQDASLFNDTIKNNILMGRTASYAQIKEALKVAHADEFVSKLSQGLETIVGERGSQLSGGQRQRISIARAILMNPAFLILDEATAALDTESEKHVQAALSELLQSRTCLIIAHRLSTIKSADYIYAIKSGKVVESGSYEALLSKPQGYFSKLVELQDLSKPEF
jgi:ATP-binding cassette, subfamily B, bacterial MsbA